MAADQRPTSPGCTFGPMPAPPPVHTRPPSKTARLLAVATVVVAAVVASATLWLPVYSVDTALAGGAPRVPIVDGSGSLANLGAVMLCGPVVLAILLLMAVWASGRTAAIALAVVMSVWTVSGFVTILIGGLVAPVVVLAFSAALLTQARASVS